MPLGSGSSDHCIDNIFISSNVIALRNDLAGREFISGSYRQS